MPASTRDILLCRYHYDPLDRLVDCTPTAQVQTRRFYCESRLATEVQGALLTSLFQHNDQLLAQQRSQHDQFDTSLLATDLQRSVLAAVDQTSPNPLAYSPYGHRPLENGLLSLLGFNGERPDPVTGHYLLGNGYRAFNPVLKRFNSADSLSPFGKGGLNAYAYCGGDPRNRFDPTGHFWGIGTFLRQLFRLKPKILKSSPVSKNVVTGMSSSAKRNSSLPKLSRGADTDVTQFTPNQIKAQAQAAESNRIEQTARWNELTAANPMPQRPANPETIPLRARDSVSSSPLGPNQYENYLNNSLGSANSAPLNELITNYTWLQQTPGPSRLADKLDHTMNKIRGNIDRQVH